MAWPVLIVSLGLLSWQCVLVCAEFVVARELKLQRAGARWARSEFGPIL